LNLRLRHAVSEFSSSRMKKIKCVQSKTHEKCEACQATNVVCQFRDRERYFAERSRIVTGLSGGSSSSSRRSSTPSTGHGDVSSGVLCDDASTWYPTSERSPGKEQSRYSSASPAPYRSSSSQVSNDVWYSPGSSDYSRSSSSYDRCGRR